jgi:hypothetical protein
MHGGDTHCSDRKGSSPRTTLIIISSFLVLLLVHSVFVVTAATVIYAGLLVFDCVDSGEALLCDAVAEQSLNWWLTMG